MVVEDELLVPGDEVVVLVLVELLELEEPLAGEASLSLTTVVLLLPLPLGGLFVSDFCSQAANKAAPARMQMSFFIMLIWNAKPIVGQWLNRGKQTLRPCFPCNYLRVRQFRMPLQTAIRALRPQLDT